MNILQKLDTLSVTLHPHDIFALLEAMVSDDSDFPILWCQGALRIVDFEDIYASIITSTSDAMCLIDEAESLDFNSSSVMSKSLTGSINDILL